MMRRFAAILLCLLTLFGCARAEFPGLSGDVQSWLDASPDMATGGEWYVLALSRLGGYDLSGCRGPLRQALGGTASHTSRLKYALVLRAAGSQDDIIAETLAQSAGQQGIMSHVYALPLMTSGVTAAGVDAAQTVQTLLDMQLADGGWALRGSSADPDVTAMVLQSLAPYMADEAVCAAAERALSCLSALQRPEGDFASYGTPNPESTAQVIIALTELGIDPLTDPRFIKDGVTLLDGMNRYRLESGGVSHTLGGPANTNATVQVFLADCALQLFQQGQPGLYRIEAPTGDAVQTAIPLTPARLSWQALAVGGVLLAAAVAVVVLAIRGKRRVKDWLPILVIAAAIVALICLTDVQSADSYYSGALPEKDNAIGTVTLSIRCDKALGHPDAPELPENGVILAPTEMAIAPGDTVFALLTEAARAYGIHLESTGGAGMPYVQGIANLYEFSLGDLSGWLYFVNGASPSVGCGQYTPADGDVIEWRYTLDMGGDLTD